MDGKAKNLPVYKKNKKTVELSLQPGCKMKLGSNRLTHIKNQIIISRMDKEYLCLKN